MTKFAITALSVALLSASGITYAGAHQDPAAKIAALQNEKAVLAKRLNNAIAYSKERAMQIEALQTKVSSADNSRMELNSRLNNAIAFSKQRAAKIDMLQAKANSEATKSKALSKRLSNAIAFSKQRAAQIDTLQAKAESGAGTSKALNTRLNNAISFSKQRAEQIKSLQQQLNSEQTSRKALGKRLANAISYSKERAQQLKTLQAAGGQSDWAPGVTSSLSAAIGGMQGTTVEPQADNSVKIQVGNNGLFNTGSAVLSSGGNQLLSAIAQELSVTDANLTIVGHTDNVPVGGNNTYSSNEALSFARAVSTMEFLRQQGFSTQRLAAAGYGASNPIASNDTAEGRQQNRRVEIILNQR